MQNSNCELQIEWERGSAISKEKGNLCTVVGEIAKKGGRASIKFWWERPRGEGEARRKMKREKGIGAERNYFWGEVKWTRSC